MPATVNTKSLKKELLQVLKDNILGYWIKNTIDTKYGGFLGYVNSNNRVDPNAGKGIILNTRILWTFSAAGIFLKDSYYKEIADLAYNYIRDKFIDNKFGGVYWELNYKGEPVNRKKQIYAHAFTIYALSEYYLLSRKDEALKLAKEIYYLIEKYSYDNKYKGYIEAFGEDWTNLEDVRLSNKDRNAKKTMNTHLHILEAYTNLHRIWPDKKVYGSLKELIKVFTDFFVNNQNHLNLFFSDKWKLTDNIISFGHDIEFTWLLTEASEAINDPELTNKTKDLAVKMVDTVIKEGFDTSGGIAYEMNPESDHKDHDKHWWVQAEGMVGLVNAYQITNNHTYLEKAAGLWKFIDSYIIDHKYGEWFWRVNNLGKPYREDEKAGFWKCPYHNSRMCIELINRL